MRKSKALLKKAVSNTMSETRHEKRGPNTAGSMRTEVVLKVSTTFLGPIPMA